MQNDINEWKVKAEEQQHKVARVRSLCAGKANCMEEFATPDTKRYGENFKA
jgi:hypothetical protein